MQTHPIRFTARAPRAAVRCAVVALALAGSPAVVTAQEPAPQSMIELGPDAVSEGSYKAGEYNGLANKGGYFSGNADLRSRSVFDADSALRWRIKGTDLGLDTRTLFAVVGAQGTYRVNFAFDQLRRNRSDTFQTPFLGAGGSTLTLPSSWTVPVAAGSTSANARGLVPSIGGLPFISAGTLVQPTAAQLAAINTNASIDLPLFSTYDLHTTRTRFDGGANYHFSPAWSVDANFRPEEKTGAKPMGTVTRGAGEMSTTLPDPVDYRHNQITTNVNYATEKSFLQAGYYGSFFRNGVSAVNWQIWSTPGTAPLTNTITSAPGNDFNEVNATAGASLSPKTKVTGNFAYSRGTQNDPFVLLGAATPVVPLSSANGLVVTTSAYGKVTNHPSKKVNLAASYKFDNRDNQTPVNIYQFGDAQEAVAASTAFAPNNPLGPVLAQNANANRPYSRRLNLLNTDADFNVARGQFIKAGYDFEMVDRWCPGSWIDCADAARTKENTARAEWRTRASEDVTARVDYAYSFRRGDYNENSWLALVPYANVVPVGATQSAYQAMLQNNLTGYGPVAGYNGGVSPNPTFFPMNNAIPPSLYANSGNRISELIGMRRFYVADRNRNRLRSQLQWQATEQMALSFGGDVTRDDYPNSTYGLQNYNTYAADADLSYALGADFSLSIYYTYENLKQLTAGNTYTANSNGISNNGATMLSGAACDSFATMQQRNNNNKLDPCLNWASSMLDVAHTGGVGLRKVTGPLDLSANVTYTRQRWDNTPTGGNWVNNPLVPPGSPASAIAAIFVPATPTPTVSADTTELRLDGRYNVGPGAVRVGYAYLHMTNADFMYEGMQFGTLNGVLPTNEQPFNYGVHVVSVTYVMTF